MHSLCLILIDRIQAVGPTYIRREGYSTTSQWKSDKELAVLVCSCGSRQAQLRCLHSVPFPTAIFAISLHYFMVAICIFKNCISFNILWLLHSNL